MRRAIGLRQGAPSTWKALRDEFLGSGTSPAAGLKMWRALTTHPWFREQLECCARQVLKQNAAPAAWQADVEQQVILLLAQKLQKLPDLGIDAALADQHFTGWLTTIVTRDCRQALRRQQRLHGYGQRVPIEHPAIDDRVQRETRVDLNLALARMEIPERTVITLWMNGHSIKQISNRLQLNYGRTYRIFTRGMKKLRRMLA